MRQGKGELVELYLDGGRAGGRILCPPNLMPAPGQYLLGNDHASSFPLPAPIFSAGSIPDGFIAASPIPDEWRPGSTLSLRGPLGRGFSLSASSRHVVLIALGDTSARLKPLIMTAFEQNASVVLVSELDLPDLPPEVEIRPVSSLPEVAGWADYAAIDVPREKLSGLREQFGFGKQVGGKVEAQVLVVTPMPCGGVGECGVCAVAVRGGWKMACKDGPVFDLNDLV